MDVYPKDIADRIFSIRSEEEFNALAIEVFQIQSKHNLLYSSYLKSLNRNLSYINAVSQIPFLPIQFFKTRKILTGGEEYQLKFQSSGTTDGNTSTHYLKDEELYVKSFLKGFESSYGPASDYSFLCLLPSYLEREGSSLIYMADHLIKTSDSAYSGFYLDEYEKLLSNLEKLQAAGKKTILLGVSFALLELAERGPFNFKDLIVMETGGMKGKRKELTRAELHDRLKSGFGVEQIHSEYGMTELLSQAYSKGDGKFTCPPWMKILTREVNDPFTIENQRPGGINVIDLANIHSCSFIATQDLGLTNNDGSFEVLGRFDYSDVRGCNLLI